MQMMQLVIMNSRFQKLDEFFYRDLADIGEIGAGRSPTTVILMNFSDSFGSVVCCCATS